MIWRDVKIAGSSNPGRNNKISAEATYNMVVTDGALVNFPGYKYVSQINPDASQKSRGIYLSQLGGFMLVASGQGIFRIESDLTAQHLGDVKNNPEGIEFAENGNSQIAISDGDAYYVYNYGSAPSFTEINKNNYSSICSAKGYIFAATAGSNTFSYSNVNDATTAFPIDNTGEIGSDKIVALRPYNDSVWVFGERSTKVWHDLGSAVNPWSLDPSSVMEYGCLNKRSIASAYGYMVWVSLSEDGLATILASDGGRPQEISTPGLDAKFSRLSNPSECSAFMFQMDGHTFYQLTFIEDDFTIVYDFTDNSFYYATDEDGNKYIAQKLINFNRKYYFISFDDAYLYEMSGDFTTYDYLKDKNSLRVEQIPRRRITSPYRTKTYDYYRISALQIVMREGMTEDTPRVDVSWSNDGGETFRDARRLLMSQRGDRYGIMQTNLLGAARDWTFKYEFITNGAVCAISSAVQVNNADFSAAA